MLWTVLTGSVVQIYTPEKRVAAVQQALLVNVVITGANVLTGYYLRPSDGYHPRCTRRPRSVDAHRTHRTPSARRHQMLPYHLVRRAALLGIICDVAPKDGEEASDLFESWVSIGDPPSREAALTKLACRYLAAYHPASLADFASRSRLPMRDIREGWEVINDATTAVTVSGAPAKLLTDAITDESTSNTDVRLFPLTTLT